jgi:putative PIN family toxin of toxin-antitoxin system
VLSEHIIAETNRTLEDPYFQQRLTPQQIAEALMAMRQEAAVIPITVEIHGVATHPEDDLVLATAVSAGVEYLVTGDTKLQQLGSYEGVQVLSPRQFLDLLEAQEQGL